MTFKVFCLVDATFPELICDNCELFLLLPLEFFHMEVAGLRIKECSSPLLSRVYTVIQMRFAIKQQAVIPTEFYLVEESATTSLHLNA